MKVKEAIELFALNANDVIEVDICYDNGETACIGAVYGYMDERKVNDTEIERFGECEIVKTETMVDLDDGEITFDLIISRNDKNVKENGNG
ncbi:MAG: hypothetical protein IJK26_10220 [Clostridia bacterium]|nr:hypothetical protein [Clostridia bacterium]